MIIYKCDLCEKEAGSEAFKPRLSVIFHTNDPNGKLPISIIDNMIYHLCPMCADRLLGEARKIKEESNG